MPIPRVYTNKKIVSVSYQDKDNAASKYRDISSYTKQELESLWQVQYEKMKTIGGLTKLQKVLKRSNLPPLANSIQNLRFTKVFKPKIT